MSRQIRLFYTIPALLITPGDGSTVQSLTSAELVALSGNVSHVFSDDQDGSVNATDHTINVIVSSDEDGGSSQNQTVTVNNVAPTIALIGTDHAVEDTTYTLTLGAVTDPGQDTVSSYMVNWGDGNNNAYSITGNVNHIYANPGDFAINVDLVDEDGSYVNVAGKALTVNPAVQPEIIHLGDAKGLPTLSNPNIWASFWSNSIMNISHKTDYSNAGEGWTATKLNTVGSTTLSGGDLWNGDLGVSGRNLATSSIQQEIQGHEALRFALTDSTRTAAKVEINLTQFFSDDDGNALDYNEAGRLQAFDANGNVVKEVVFSADSLNGTHWVALDSNIGFSAVVLTAGSYDGNNNFVFGAYDNDSGQSIVPYSQDTQLHGSDFLVDNIQFELTLIGVSPLQL